MRVIGISAGRENGNNEILLKHVLAVIRQITDCETEIIRLANLKINDCTGCEACMRGLISGGDGKCVQRGDDFQWLLEKIIDADGLIVAAPVYDLLPSGNIIRLLNRALGVGKDYRNRCEEQKKVCAAISIGGSDWIDFAEPVMNLVLTNLSKGAVVVNRLVQGGYTAPAMVLLDDKLLNKATKLGEDIAGTILDRQKAVWQGSEGICPGCHCNLLVPRGGLDVTCAFCKARGKIALCNGELTVNWEEQTVRNHRFTKQGERDHQADIAKSHKRAFMGRELIKEKRKSYLEMETMKEKI